MKKNLCVVDHIAKESNKSSLSALLRNVAVSPTRLINLKDITLCVHFCFLTPVQLWSYCMVNAVISQPCGLAADL